MDIVKRRRMTELMNEGIGMVEAFEIAFEEGIEKDKAKTEPNQANRRNRPNQ